MKRTTTILSGRIRQTVARESSIICVRASSAKQIAVGQRLWMMQYRDAGLFGEADDPCLQEQQQSEFQEIGRHHWEDDREWNSILINAYRISTSLGDAFNQTGFRASSQVAEFSVADLICGTVTLLVPRDSDDSVGRITKLAIKHQSRVEASNPIAYRRVFLELTSSLFQAAIEGGMTHLEAVVHPRHAKLYRRVFGAEAIGESFFSPEVAGAPAQLMKADIRDPANFHPRLKERYMQCQNHGIADRSP